MKEFGKWFIGVIIVLIVMFAIGFLIQGGDFFLYKFFAPKQENVRREVFENTKSYREGVSKDISMVQMEYVQCKDVDGKRAIGKIILDRYADYDLTKLPDGLQTFMNELKQKEGLR